MLKNKKGFTLVEILTVVALIAILFVVFVPRIDFATNKARLTGVESDFRAFDIAAEQVMKVNAGSTDTAATEAGNLNKYLDAAMQINSDGNATDTHKDPWGNTYKVAFAANQMTFTSYGPDGATGTEGGKNADDLVLTVKYVSGKVGAKTSGLDNNMAWDTTTFGS